MHSWISFVKPITLSVYEFHIQRIHESLIETLLQHDSSSIPILRMINEETVWNEEIRS